MSVVYVDTSAVLKRPIAETETAAVHDAFRRHRQDGALVLASSLAWLEVWRAFRRLRFEDVARGVHFAMSGIEEVILDQSILRLAQSVGADGLRSLDAIHLASAVMVGADAVMTYDDRLAAAVRSTGIRVLRPVV